MLNGEDFVFIEHFSQRSSISQLFLTHTHTHFFRPFRILICNTHSFLLFSGECVYPLLFTPLCESEWVLLFFSWRLLVWARIKQRCACPARSHPSLWLGCIEPPSLRLGCSDAKLLPESSFLSPIPIYLMTSVGSGTALKHSAFFIVWVPFPRQFDDLALFIYTKVGAVRYSF